MQEKLYDVADLESWLEFLAFHRFKEVLAQVADQALDSTVAQLERNERVRD